ncbi:MAG: hypothetical protein TRG1_1976 [Flavobacteriaceae bacterium FS1-H7996/R]|nr:MAG: hypothetical protein TRG1_1976 [Flavobacteriaceae bacterium FS1-H7996/R]
MGDFFNTLYQSIQQSSFMGGGIFVGEINVLWDEKMGYKNR